MCSLYIFYLCIYSFICLIFHVFILIHLFSLSCINFMNFSIHLSINFMNFSLPDGQQDTPTKRRLKGRGEERGSSAHSGCLCLDVACCKPSGRGSPWLPLAGSLQLLTHSQAVDSTRKISCLALVGGACSTVHGRGFCQSSIIIVLLQISLLHSFARYALRSVLRKSLEVDLGMRGGLANRISV